MAVVIVVVALLAALLIADRVAVIYMQGRIAAHVGDRGFSARPHVTIAGFPFLTQLAARRLNRVVISATGKKLGLVEVKRLDVTLYGLRASPSCKSSTASRLSGTALVGLAGLAGAGGTPGLTVCADGPDRVKITAGLGLVTRTATARVTRAGPGGIRAVVISAGGIPVAALGLLRDITLSLPALPRAMTIQSVSVTSEGVHLHLAGRNVRFRGACRADPQRRHRRVQARAPVRDDRQHQVQHRRVEGPGMLAEELHRVRLNQLDAPPRHGQPRPGPRQHLVRRSESAIRRAPGRGRRAG